MKIRTKDIPQPIHKLLDEAVAKWEKERAPEVSKELKRLLALKERGETHDVTF